MSFQKEVPPPYTTWGYITGMISDISDIKQTSFVVSLYLKDMENDNFWWGTADDDLS